MLQDLVKKEKNRVIGQSICLALLGLLIVLFPAFSGSVFSMVVGIGCIVFGVLALVFFFLTFIVFEPKLLIEGIALIVIGSLILSYPETFLTIIVYVLAIEVIYEGVMEIIYSVKMKKLGIKDWYIDLIYGIIMLALGVTAITLNLISSEFFLIVIELIGASIIFEAVVRVLLVCVIHHDYKQIKKELTKNVVSEQ